jgi:hypothetical protein
MSDLSANSPTTPKPHPRPSPSLAEHEKAAGRLQTGFAVQSLTVKIMLAVIAVLIAATAPTRSCSRRGRRP